MEAARAVLAEVFGYPGFRGGQSEAVAAAMEGSDAVVLLPTGAGKSLCYQVPAIAHHRAGRGMTLVISPLIALMQDQVQALEGRGVSAAAIHSHQTDKQVVEALAALERGELALLYVSPERAAQEGFRQRLRQQSIALLAIDEAHCVSQWGHDFRPEYMQLAELRETTDAPMMAVTATATERVRKELTRRLALVDPTVVRGDFRRPNLAFSVEHIAQDQTRIQRMIALLDNAGIRAAQGGQAIVYCATRKHTERVSDALASAGFAARHYHAGCTQSHRDKAQYAFGVGRLRVLVATNAFGMGIDYPNIRLVVHYQTPGSLEAYYQEAGRAGRDKEPAACVMFFAPRDIATQRRIASGKSRGIGEALRAIEAYAETDECREQQICVHFGVEDSPPCGRCNNCRGEHFEDEASAARREEVALLDDAGRALLLAAVDELSKPAGKTNIARALRGSRAKALNKCGLLKISQHGTLRDVEERVIVRTIEDCLSTGELVHKGNKYPTVWLPGKPVRQSNRDTASAESEAKQHTFKRRSFPKKKSATKSRAAYSLLQGALERFRKTKARQLKWKPYMVFQKRTLVALDEMRPTSLEELEAVPGLGRAKIDRFGEELLQLVREHS